VTKQGEDSHQGVSCAEPGLMEGLEAMLVQEEEAVLCFWWHGQTRKVAQGLCHHPAIGHFSLDGSRTGCSPQVSG